MVISNENSQKVEYLENQLLELKNQSDKIQTNRENIDAKIASVIEKNETDIQMLTKKIKYAYILAGGSLGLAIIELIMIILRVR